MPTWSKPNAIVPGEPLRWILATLRFYAIVASAGVALAFAVISILALAPAVLHHKGIMPPIGTGQIGRIEDPGGTMVGLIALILFFGAATYFTGRLYGTAGYIACGAGFAVLCITLAVLGGLGIFG